MQVDREYIFEEQPLLRKSGKPCPSNELQVRG